MLGKSLIKHKVPEHATTSYIIGCNTGKAVRLHLGYIQTSQEFNPLFLFTKVVKYPTVRCELDKAAIMKMLQNLKHLFGADDIRRCCSGLDPGLTDKICDLLATFFPKDDISRLPVLPDTYYTVMYEKWHGRNRWKGIRIPLGVEDMKGQDQDMEDMDDVA